MLVKQTLLSNTMSSDKWTIADIPDLTGKTIIVTGGSSGLGFESVKEFAGKGADVTMASHSISNMKKAKKRILAENPKAKKSLMELDLVDINPVQRFTKHFYKSHSLNKSSVKLCLK